MMAREKISSVWAAEHGASSIDPDEPEGANAGHRFRIHGRLSDEIPEQLLTWNSGPSEGPEPAAMDSGEQSSPPSDANEVQPDPQDGERMRERLAQATEIDLADVHIEVGSRTVALWGTVADDGERRQLEELVDRLTDTKPVTSRLRPRNP